MLFGLLKNGSFTGEVKDFSTKPDPNPVKNLEWRPFRHAPAPGFDPATQKLSPETATVFATEIVASRSVVALTPTELDNIDKGKIVGAMLDHAFITIKLVDILLAKATIAAGDFDAETRQEFLDMKALVDKLRP